ncbi:MAG: family 78 glycoside hydrolase catalytic domain [Kiritimatiellaeota bacterium]|nr:family 78 glycoside hydrolase catalytic domain [Kiritimatiellota bacterium]
MTIAACIGPGIRAAMTIGELRCEYALNPIGIDTLQPRLSWTLNDDRRGQRQSAYHIQVAALPEDLSQDKALLWDTGKIASDQNTHIVYTGAALHAGARCHWRVRAWDKQGQPSPWSAPAFWQVALLQASDWKAKWIGLPGAGAPEWRDITLAADVTIQKGAVGILFRVRDNSNYYMWQINAALGPELLLRPHILKNGTWSMLPPVSLRQVIPATDDLKTHRVEIETHGTTIRTRIDGKLIDERDDTTFAFGAIGFRADSKESSLVDNLLVTDVSGNVLLKKGQLALANATLLCRSPLPKDCPRLRKTFVLTKSVRRATASVCGLGFYEIYLNGAKAADRVLAPANTFYPQRLLFDTLDVTAAVKQGDNAVGLWLAPGYSDDYSQWGWKWEDAKRAILQLDVVYDDGTTTTIITDESWQAGTSPLAFASLYDGEVYDAGLEMPGWSTSAFTAEGWQPVRVLEATLAKLAPNVMPPVRVIQRIRPISVAEPKPGVFVFDMGQNFAGWVRLRATGARGTRIVLRHSELIGKDGMLDPWTNRLAKATDTFVLRGEGSEVYEPRFTYHGFRYVEVTSFPGRPTLDDITGCVVHADVQPAGTFTTSDAMINRIHRHCVWSMRSNFMSIPTDCPVRDERTPCQMDSLAYEDAALCNFWMNRYYTKWLGDIRGEGRRDNPDWSGDMIFLPWRLYWYYGDIRILEVHYANMRVFIEELRAKTPGHIYTAGFGDWCRPNDGTWAGYFGNVTEVNTSLYAVIARIVGETAALLGKSEDAARYAGWADEITKAFHAKNFDAQTATYGNGSQTTAILPLALNLVPQDKRGAVFDRLVTTIQGKDEGHLDTGIFGTRYLVDVLCDFGQQDLAVSMLKQPDYPGFGFQIAQGATTLWEQWTFKGSMNSHGHVAFAGVDSSFFTRLAGITARKPAFAQIGIRPYLPKALTFAEATQETVKGRVTVRWQKNNGNIEMRVNVPVNTSALVSVPASNKNTVTESGRPAETSEGVEFIGMEGDYAIFAVGSGDYHFVWVSGSP